MKILISIYIFSMLFVSAFLFSETITYTIIIGIIILFFNVLRLLIHEHNVLIKQIPATLLIIGLFLLFLFFSMALTNLFLYKSYKSLYIICYLFFIVFFKYIFCFYKLPSSYRIKFYIKSGIKYYNLYKYFYFN